MDGWMDGIIDAAVVCVQPNAFIIILILPSRQMFEPQPSRRALPPPASSSSTSWTRWPRSAGGGPTRAG